MYTVYYSYLYELGFACGALNTNILIDNNYIKVITIIIIIKILLLYN